MRITVAYADPPYPGKARKHYGREEVDHIALIADLVERFPDGWALSTNSTALRDLLPLCPPDVRVAAWVKPFAIWKRGVNPTYAWEPLIWRGGRRLAWPDRTTVRDWLSCNITLRRGLVGVKPEAFCFWLFDLLGLERGDKLVDLYPGSGAVTEAWRAWRRKEATA